MISVASIWRHLQLIDNLNTGGEGFKRPSRLAIVVAGILAVVGSAMALYLSYPSQNETLCAVLLMGFNECIAIEPKVSLRRKK